MPSPGDGFVIIEETAGRPSGDNSLFPLLRQFLDEPIRFQGKSRVANHKLTSLSFVLAFEHGWKWSESVQPLAKTKSCEAPHFQYHVSGVAKIRMDDGTEFVCRAGDVSLLPSGHNAWVEGKEPVVIVDFQGMVDYARQK